MHNQQPHPGGCPALNTAIHAHQRPSMRGGAPDGSTRTTPTHAVGHPNACTEHTRGDL